MNRPEFELVEGHPELIRDTYSKGIVNNDTDAYQKYMSAALKRKERNSQINETVEEINNIKNEMSEMKEVLQQILNKVNGN